MLVWKHCALLALRRCGGGELPFGEKATVRQRSSSSSDYYYWRLWCVFELAAFIHSRPQGEVCSLPLAFT